MVLVSWRHRDVVRNDVDAEADECHEQEREQDVDQDHGVTLLLGK
jgi:hypothetical protein